MRQRGCSLGGAKPKLDPEQVVAVRRAHANGDTVASLARVHKVSRMTVYRMLEGRRWSASGNRQLWTEPHVIAVDDLLPQTRPGSFTESMMG
ncbi:helix-turn-helix domain-containing protein [Mycolicibacterium litorale]|uniref:Helix-turn-helix domain-containing protein n=1 Tax=Candidatus Mycolicibacterium alkanivorans TaxID=2954114 RepID=A0ABS9YWI6_9MYCO|nr:helix-turn-helix domain-containing protein [Candidatus Mycolicibacterium alkanivorans]